MGFYLRKALSIGPLRLNLSRSGVGLSVGIKGARLGVGPRGSYVHVGRGGIYYRKSLSSSESDLASPSHTTAVGQTSDASQDAVTCDLDHAYHSSYPRLLLTAAAAIIILSVAAFIPNFPSWGYIFLLPLLATAAWRARRLDYEARGMRSSLDGRTMPSSAPNLPPDLDRIIRGCPLVADLDECLKAGRWEGFYEKAKAAYELVPLPIVRYYRGLGAFQLKHYDEAEEDLVAANREKTIPAWTDEGLAQAAVLVGESDRSAIEQVRKELVRLSYRPDEMAFNTAVVFHHAAKYREAAEWARKVSPSSKFHFDAENIVALGDYHAGSFEAAMQRWSCLADAADEQARRASAAFNASCCAARLSKEDEVKDWLARALRDGYEKSKIYAEPDLKDYVIRPSIRSLLS